MTGSISQRPLSELHLNEAARPSAPALPDVTEAQRGAGRHLAVIHRHHLMELARARSIYRHVTEGRATPSAFLDVLEGMDFVQNSRLFGTLCGRECQMLTFHHDAEEQHVFPTLESKGSEALGRVVAKLRAEHLVVHELITRLQKSADGLETAPTEANFQETSALLERLDAVGRSHFGYEETELAEALGVYMDGF